MFSKPIRSIVQRLRGLLKMRKRNPRPKSKSEEEEHIKRIAELIFFQSPIEEQDKWVSEMIDRGYFKPFEYEEWRQSGIEDLQFYSTPTTTQHPAPNSDYSTPTTTQHLKSSTTLFT